MRDVAGDASRQVAAYTEAMRQFVGTDCYAQLMGLLESLKTVYMHDLVSVSPDGLQAKQGALQQVMALQSALESDARVGPRI